MWLASHERPLERNELAHARAAARLGFPERQVRVARLGSLVGPPDARSARSEPGATSLVPSDRSLGSARAPGWRRSARLARSPMPVARARAAARLARATFWGVFICSARASRAAFAARRFSLASARTEIPLGRPGASRGTSLLLGRLAARWGCNNGRGLLFCSATTHGGSSDSTLKWGFVL